MATTQHAIELADAIDLAKDLFQFSTYRWVNPENVRLGPVWLGVLSDDSPNVYGVWIGSEREGEKPDGDPVGTYSDAFEAVAELVGRYAWVLFRDCSAALRSTDEGGRA